MCINPETCARTPMPPQKQMPKQWPKTLISGMNGTLQRILDLRGVLLYTITHYHCKPQSHVNAAYGSHFEGLFFFLCSSRVLGVKCHQKLLSGRIVCFFGPKNVCIICFYTFPSKSMGPMTAKPWHHHDITVTSQIEITNKYYLWSYHIPCFPENRTPSYMYFSSRRHTMAYFQGMSYFY